MFQCFSIPVFPTLAEQRLIDRAKVQGRKDGGELYSPCAMYFRAVELLRTLFLGEIVLNPGIPNHMPGFILSPYLILSYLILLGLVVI